MLCLTREVFPSAPDSVATSILGAFPGVLMVALVDITAGTVEAGTGITGGSPPSEKVGRVGGSADDGGRPPS